MQEKKSPKHGFYIWKYQKSTLLTKDKITKIWLKYNWNKLREKNQNL